MHSFMILYQPLHIQCITRTRKKGSNFFVKSACYAPKLIIKRTFKKKNQKQSFTMIILLILYILIYIYAILFLKIFRHEAYYRIQQCWAQRNTLFYAVLVTKGLILRNCIYFSAVNFRYQSKLHK